MKKELVLVIDTAGDNINLLLGKKEGQIIDTIKIGAKYRHSEILLEKINEILGKKKVKLDNLGVIIVNKGPGSFTALRAGIATANSLAWALAIPALGLSGDTELLFKNGVKKSAKTKPGQLVIPEYGSEPKISKPRVSRKV